MKFKDRILNKNDLHENGHTKYIFILSMMLFIMSIITFAPVNTLIFSLDMLGHSLRYISVLVFINIIITVFTLIKRQIIIKKNLLLLSAVSTFFISYITYLICFSMNVFDLFV